MKKQNGRAQEVTTNLSSPALKHWESRDELPCLARLKTFYLYLFKSCVDLFSQNASHFCGFNCETLSTCLSLFSWSTALQEVKGLYLNLFTKIIPSHGLEARYNRQGPTLPAWVSLSY